MDLYHLSARICDGTHSAARIWTPEVGDCEKILWRFLHSDSESHVDTSHVDLKSHVQEPRQLFGCDQMNVVF